MSFCGWMGAEPDPSALGPQGSSPGALLSHVESMAGVFWQLGAGPESLEAEFHPSALDTSSCHQGAASANWRLVLAHLNSARVLSLTLHAGQLGKVQLACLEPLAG